MSASKADILKQQEILEDYLTMLKSQKGQSKKALALEATNALLRVKAGHNLTWVQRSRLVVLATNKQDAIDVVFILRAAALLTEWKAPVWVKHG